MRNKFINSTSGHKPVTGNGFSDIDFLYDVQLFAVRRCFTSIINFGDLSLRMCSFHHTTTSYLKSDVIFEFSAPVFP